MNREDILQELREERDRLSQAIEALEGAGRSGRGAKSGPASKLGRSKGITAAGRRRLSMLMKKRWAERKKKASKAA